jgi:NAD(P)H-dependent FMN reductase
MEFPAPESVAKVRRAVQEADGIWIFTPEYNYQIPGVLKNLLDWLSRPLAPNDWERGSAVKGKAVTISAVAGRSGGTGVRKQISALLETMSMRLIGGMGTGVVLDGDAFQTDVLKLNREHLSALEAQADALMKAM